ITCALVERCMSVTSSGRSSVSRMMRCTSGLFSLMALAICFISVVLPALGGETISPRWPFPMGHIRSMMLVDLLDAGERGVLLGVPRELDHTLDLVAAAQAEAADHRERHVDVVGAGRERAHPQEAVAVLGADVQGAGADHLGAVVGLAATGVAALHHADAALALLEAVAPVAVAVAAPAAAGLLAAGVPAATAAPALVPVLPALAVAAPLAAVLAAVRALLGLAGRTLLALATAGALLLLAAGALLGLAVAGVLLGLGGRLAVATLLAGGGGGLAVGLALLRLGGAGGHRPRRHPRRPPTAAPPRAPRHSRRAGWARRRCWPGRHSTGERTA